MARKRTPNGLKPAGKKLWKRITESWDLRPDELSVLEAACHEADLAALLQQIIDRPGFDPYTTGSMGQVVIDPVISEVRQHRATMQRLLASLKLPDAPGAAGKDSDEEMSSAARKAANARWGNG